MPYFYHQDPGYGQQPEDFGSAFGRGIGEGLRALAALKLENYLDTQRKQRQVPGLRSLFPGKSDEELTSLAEVEPTLLREAYKQNSSLPRRQDEADLISAYGMFGIPESQESTPMPERFELRPPSLLQQPQDLAQMPGGENELSRILSGLGASPYGNGIGQSLPFGMPQQVASPIKVAERATSPTTRMFEPEQRRQVEQQRQPDLLPSQAQSPELAKIAQLRQKLETYVQKHGATKFAMERIKELDKAERFERGQELERQKFGATEAYRGRKFEQEERKIAGGEQKLAATVSKPFVETQTKVLETSPKIIADYDKVIAIAEKKPDALRTDSTQQLLQHLSLEGYGRSPEEDVVKQSIASIGMSRIQGFKGLGSMSNRDLQQMQSSEPSLLQTPQGLVAIARSQRAAEKAKLATAKATEKIRKENRGIAPFDVDIRALEESAPERDKYAQEAKDAYRKLGVEFDEDFPSKYEEDAKKLPVGQKVLVPETGVYFQKQKNGSMKMLPAQV